MHLEGEAIGELLPGGEGLGDLRIEAGGLVAGPGDLADRDFPFGEGFATQVAVGGEEGLLGPVEVLRWALSCYCTSTSLPLGRKWPRPPRKGKVPWSMMAWVRPSTRASSASASFGGVSCGRG